MTTWALMPGVKPADLGFLPMILLDADPRPAKDQLNDRYAHGGGYHPFSYNAWDLNRKTGRLTYPGDPALMPLAIMRLHHSKERCTFYPHDLLVIEQADGSFVVTRID